MGDREFHANQVKRTFDLWANGRASNVVRLRRKLEVYTEVVMRLRRKLEVYTEVKPRGRDGRCGFDVFVVRFNFRNLRVEALFFGLRP